MRERRLIQLSDADLRFIVETVATIRSDHEQVTEIVRGKPDILDRMLDDDNLFRRLTTDEEAFVRVSPWLLFTVLLRRAIKEIPQRKFTMERVGATERVPVFDVDQVSNLLHDRDVVDYLAELLSSFVRTENTVFHYRSGRRLRRRSFSDLDVDDMIALAGMVAEDSRFPFYRRIGDICLFVTGIFPEYATTVPVFASGGKPGGGSFRRRRNVTDYEAEAVRFYTLAARHPTAVRAGLHTVLMTLADHFGLARKPLSFVAENYIRPYRERLFGTTG